MEGEVWQEAMKVIRRISLRRSISTSREERLRKAA